MVLALMVGVTLAAGPTAPPPLTFGLVAALGSKTAAADGDRVAAYLKKELKHGVTPQVFKSYEDLAIALVDGKVDFAWMPPLQGYNARLAGATVVAKLIRNGSPYYRAVLFVRRDAAFTDLASLRGSKAAWVDRNSSSGYYFPVAMLTKAGLHADQLFTQQLFLGSHEDVCRAVESRKADVGATFADEPALGQDPHNVEVTGCKQVTSGAKQLRALAVSDPVPNDMLVLRKGLDATVSAALTKDILSMPEHKDGQALLKSVFAAEGVATVNDLDFAPVEQALESGSGMEVLK